MSGNVPFYSATPYIAGSDPSSLFLRDTQENNRVSSGTIMCLEEKYSEIVCNPSRTLSISRGYLKSYLCWLGGIFIWVLSYILLNTQVSLIFHQDSDYWAVIINTVLFCWTVFIIANIDSHWQYRTVQY